MFVPQDFVLRQPYLVTISNLKSEISTPTYTNKVVPQYARSLIGAI